MYVTTNACTNLAALAPTTSFGTLTAPFAVSLTQGPGTDNVCATGQGSKADLRMSMPVTLASRQVATVSGGATVAASASGGDDKRTPSDATTVKLRMINGVTGGSTGTLTLTADNAPVGIGILPAAASGCVSVPGSTNATAFGLTSSTSGTLSPTPGSSPLTANTVYSIPVGGDVAAPPVADPLMAR